ncbi:MAG: hypothetical protein Q8M65_02175, partial [Rhodoglobus sp.]|nr:hypothetical protein [Rhodoglobus sp.]
HPDIACDLIATLVVVDLDLDPHRAAHAPCTNVSTIATWNLECGGRIRRVLGGGTRASVRDGGGLIRYAPQEWQQTEGDLPTNLRLCVVYPSARLLPKRVSRLIDHQLDELKVLRLEPTRDRW